MRNNNPDIQDIMARYQAMEISRCSAQLPVGNTVEINTDTLRLFRGDSVTEIGLSEIYKMPFDDNSVHAMMFFDGLHKIDRPSDFFAEVERVLAPKGRLIITAPAVTPLSWLAYKIAGRPMNMDVNPLDDIDDIAQGNDTPNNYAPCNYAMPALLFWFQEYRVLFNQRFPQLTLVQRQWTGYLTYLPTKLPAFLAIPERLYGKLFAVERWLRPFIGRLLAPKCRIILEKRD